MSGRDHGRASCMLISSYFQLLYLNLDRRHTLQLPTMHLQTFHTQDMSDVLYHTHVLSVSSVEAVLVMKLAY